MTGTRCARLQPVLPLMAAFSFGLALVVLAASEVSSASIPPAQLTVAESTEVRVRLDRLSSAVSLSGMNLRFPGSVGRTSMFQAIRVKWRKTLFDTAIYEFEIEDRDTSASLSKFRARSLELAGSGMRLNLKPVPDRLSLVPTTSRTLAKGQRGEVDLIATMDLERYVQGVLPAEMPVKWPLEALKAQAVAARTFALFRMQSRDFIKAPYHLESTVMDQVFTMDEISDEARTKVAQAVEETKGLILRDRSQRPFAAYFHADCGGRTEEASAIWGGSERMGTAIDGACPLNPRAKWRVMLSANEIASRLRGEVAQSLTLAELSADERTASGRVDQVRLKWSDGRVTTMSGHQFRMAVGYDRVKSTNFALKAVGQGVFELSGQGYGHGVGLCQWGARHLAQTGKSFREILRHYYPIASLEASLR